MKLKKIIVLGLLLAFNFSASATSVVYTYDNIVPQDGATAAIPFEYTTSGITHPDFPAAGTNSGTKTFIAANDFCNNVGGNGDSAILINNTETDAYKYFVACMNQFFPFSEDVNYGGADCANEAVTWGGNCSGDSGIAHNGFNAIVNNDTNANTFQGYATFECKDGNWIYDNGSCVKLPKPCPAADVSWPITDPAWASSTGDPSQPRFDPQPDCTATLPASLSGIQFVDQLATHVTPATVDFSDYYDGVDSKATLRCFNGDWITESSVCIYRPLNCNAQAYTTADGCTFDLPVVAHNSTMLVNSPLPTNSVGSVTAFCWNGSLEVIAESCKLSCGNTFPARTWASQYAGDPERCIHAVNALGSRTAPDDSQTIVNTNSKLNGSFTYKCNDGFWEDNGQSCNPKNCVGVPAASFLGVDSNDGANKICTHVGQTDTIDHNTNVSITSDNLPSAFGVKDYTCEYGILVDGPNQEQCTTTIPLCNSNSPDLTPSFPIPSWNGTGSCEATCQIQVDGTMLCHDSCSDTCGCDAPCGNTGEFESVETNAACSYDAVCTADPTSICNFNVNATIDTLRCDGTNWIVDSSRCKITATANNFPPSISLGSSSLTMNENASTNVGYTISDPEGGAVIIGITSSNPLYATASYSGGQITINSGSVPSNQAVTITVSATDPVGNVSTRTINVTVLNNVVTNNAPIITGVNVASLVENTTSNIGLSVQDAESEGITLSVVSSLPARATAILSTSSITGVTSTPRLFSITINTSDVSVPTTVSITITATDTFGNSTVHVITTTVSDVISVNNAPVINNLPRYDMNESSTGSLAITVTDPDFGDVVALSTVTSSDTGVLQVTGSNLVGNTLTLNLASLSITGNKDETITVIVNDGLLTTTRVFNVRVIDSVIATCPAGIVGTLSYNFKGYTAYPDMMGTSVAEGGTITASGADLHPIRCESPYGSGGMLFCTEDYTCSGGSWVPDGGTDSCTCANPVAPTVSCNGSCYNCSQPRSDCGGDWTIMGNNTSTSGVSVTIGNVCQGSEVCSYAWTYDDFFVTRGTVSSSATTGATKHFSLENSCGGSQASAFADVNWWVTVTNITTGGTAVKSGSVDLATRCFGVADSL
jgi:hypothetical protein